MTGMAMLWARAAEYRRGPQDAQEARRHRDRSVKQAGSRAARQCRQRRSGGNKLIRVTVAAAAGPPRAGNPQLAVAYLQSRRISRFSQVAVLFDETGLKVRA